jgi:2-C-methyl-D-erythritol 4-phosphate cytidylyltransferase/2-C-methyl-D-erythritol 2,4-cyclodiphosphate synthase
LGAAVSAFASCPQIDFIVLTVPPGGEDAARSSLPAELLAAKNRIFFVNGGTTRRASVHNALLFLKPYMPSQVLIHDGARPWIKRDLIERIMEAAAKSGAVIPALSLIETPKELSCENFTLSENGISPGGACFIKRHLRRGKLCTAQTPQGFVFKEILKAHEKAKEREEKEAYEYTDDAEIWGEFAGQVAVIPGDPENKKITYPEDLEVLGLCFTEQIPPIEPFSAKQNSPVQRIGLGKDLHRLMPGRRFLLGGVEIPFEKGEAGHSDGDALAHAVCDAVLGAAGLGDIGELYPAGDPAWKDADSLILLRGAWEKVKSNGWRLVNLDCTITCESPKILPHRNSIRRSLSHALDADPDAVFVKGKTNEGLGPLGTGEAVEAMAVCLIEKS